MGTEGAGVGSERARLVAVLPAGAACRIASGIPDSKLSMTNYGKLLNVPRKPFLDYASRLSVGHREPHATKAAHLLPSMPTR